MSGELEEIVIESPAAAPRRWPTVLLYVGFALVLAPLLVLAYINLIFWGFSGEAVNVHLVLLIALPVAWLAALAASIIARRRRFLVGTIGLCVVIALLMADLFVIVPAFMS